MSTILVARNNLKHLAIREPTVNIYIYSIYIYIIYIRVCRYSLYIYALFFPLLNALDKLGKGLGKWDHKL